MASIGTIIGLGRVRSAAAAAAAAACALALPAAGQEAAIAHCNGLPTDAERVACLTDALRRTGVDVDLTAEPGSAPRPAPAPAAEPESRRRFGFDLPFIGGERDEEQPRVATREEEEEFGAGRVVPRAAPEIMNANVVASEVVPYRRLQVELDNGQVWRQSNADDSWDPIRNDEPRSVEIQPRLGGYRMKVNDDGPSLMVERVR